jgi:hypothetical protein
MLFEDLAPLTAVNLGVDGEAFRVSLFGPAFLSNRTTLFVDLVLVVDVFDDLEPVDFDFKASPLHWESSGY